MLGITPSTTVTIHCKRREKEWNTLNSGNAEHSANDASVLEPLARLLWLFPVTAHGETQEESAVVRGFLNRHQRGVVRGDATSVIESLGACRTPITNRNTLISGHGHTLSPSLPHATGI